LGTGIAHRCDPGDDYGACPREALAHALTRALARPTSGLAPSTTTSPLSPSSSKRRSPMCSRGSGSCSVGEADATAVSASPADFRGARPGGDAPCRGRVVAGNTPPPGGPHDTHATNRLTRRPAWTCWVIPQDPVCPAHPPCRLRRAHHQHADRGHAQDADLDRNRPPWTAPIRPKNASSRAQAGGEVRFRVRHCSADNSRITLSTYRLARGRRVHSSAVSSRQAARYSSEIRCRSATKLGSVPIREIS
jgi:hypothetical protein